MTDRGRPTKYDTAMCDTVRELGKQGLTHTAIAATLDVSRETLYRWRDEYEDFSDALKAARSAAQHKWERILMGQANGSINGNATAAIFAMKNQFPDDYRDRREMDVKAEVGVFEIDFTGYDEDEDEAED